MRSKLGRKQLQPRLFQHHEVLNHHWGPSGREAGQADRPWEHTAWKDLRGHELGLGQFFSERSLVWFGLFALVYK